MFVLRSPNSAKTKRDVYLEIQVLTRKLNALSCFSCVGLAFSIIVILIHGLNIYILQYELILLVFIAKDLLYSQYVSII